MKRNARLQLLGLLLAVALASSACAGSDEAQIPSPTATQPEATTTPPKPTAAPPEATTAPEPTAVPEPEPAASEPFQTATPAQAIGSVVELISGDRGLTADEYHEAFAAQFREQFPFDAFMGINNQLISQGPWTILETLADDGENATFLVVDNADAEFALDVVIADGRISGLLLQPWTEPPATFEDALGVLNGAGEFAYVAAEVNADNSCRTISGQDSDRVMPLGSVYKLLVLGALVDAVNGGTIAWDQPVTIVDELDTYRGETQDVPAGETRTVRELAEAMISVSDNTATDHLLFLVGRTAVEDTQDSWGVSDPDLNRPFMSSRELFHLKLDLELGEQYLASNVEDRRIILDALASEPLPPVDQVDSTWTTPIAITTLEWFATPSDICRVLARLSEDDEALRILQINPGVPSDRWAAVGYKGGSEPGVLAMAWILTDDDGGRWVLAGSVWNETETGSPDPLAQAFAALRDQLDVDS